MANPRDSHRKEQPSTYFVQDRRNEAELARLITQDRLITDAMGGPLPEQADPASFRRVLDIGCGPGGWCIDMAQAYPDTILDGIDISSRMVEYARAQSVAQQVNDRVTFHTMDVLRHLEFPDATFDLVNIRCSVSYVRTWDWPKLIGEMLRVTRPGGVIRVTEPEIVQQSTSSALTQLLEMLQCALYRSGHLFVEESTGLNAHLAPLLARYGIRDIDSRTYALTYHGGTPEGQLYYETTRQGTLRPFMEKWGCLSNDFDALYEQALNEIQQSSFQVTWNYLSIWGCKI